MSESKTCRDCSNPFEFTEGEAVFYKSKGLKEPQRCKDCRKKRKIERAKKFVAAEDFPDISSF